MLTELAGSDGPAMCCESSVSRGPATPLQIRLYAVASASAARNPRSKSRVLLVLSSPDEVPKLSADLIGPVFALSPTEARVAAALCSGLTINEYANAAGVTIGTARSQLKQVLAKTRANREADLVRQICALRPVPASASTA